MRSSARLKYLVHTLGVDGFRALVEKYLGQKMEPWVPLPEWKYLDWMGWHEQGDGKLMLGINVEQGRVADSPGLRVKSCLRALVDNYGVDLLLTPSQSIVLRNIQPAQKYDVEAVLREHGIKLIDEVDAITRKSIACPAFPLCGLAMTEAERVQPDINAKLNAVLRKLGMANDDFVTRTTGCPNGCARPYMAEIAFVGSGPNAYQLWLGGSPDQAGRTGQPTSLFKMKYDDLEDTVEPIFAMWKTQRATADEVSPNPSPTSFRRTLALAPIPAQPQPQPQPRPRPRPGARRLLPPREYPRRRKVHGDLRARLGRRDAQPLRRPRAARARRHGGHRHGTARHRGRGGFRPRPQPHRAARHDRPRRPRGLSTRCGGPQESAQYACPSRNGRARSMLPFRRPAEEGPSIGTPPPWHTA